MLMKNSTKLIQRPQTQTNNAKRAILFFLKKISKISKHGKQIKVVKKKHTFCHIDNIFSLEF